MHVSTRRLRARIQYPARRRCRAARRSPRRPTDRHLAYAQSEWICEYLVETHGYEILNKMVKRFREGQMQRDIIPELTGLSVQELHEAFVDWAREQASTWGLPLDPIQGLLGLLQVALKFLEFPPVGELIENRGTLSADIQTNLSPVITADNCFTEKINLSKTDWTAECSPPEMSLSIDAGNVLTFDMNFDLGNFRVFTKIVDTAEGNSDTGGLVTSGELGGEGVVASNTGLMNPPHTPYLYRIEVQAEDSTNPRERSRLSAEYAY